MGTVANDSTTPLIWKLNGSEQMRLTSTGLGIGTSSPSKKLEVSSSSNTLIKVVDTTGTVNNFFGNFGGFGYVGMGTNHALGIYTNDTLRATFDTSGNLGLGVTPSAWDSTLKAMQISTSAVFSGQPTTEVMRLGSNWYYNAGWKYIGTGNATRYDQASGSHSWYTASSGTAGNTISFTQAMTLDSGGNLGIGLTNPSSILHISSANPIFKLTNTSSNDTPYLQAGVSGDGYMYVSGGSGRGVKLAYNAGTVGATLDASGNLLVGQTTTGLQAARSFSFQGVGDGSCYVSHSTVNASGDSYIQFGYNGTKIGSITQNGTTGVLYNLTSDYRLKNNQEALTGAKDFIMALKPKKWQWWDGSGEGVGFVAHEFMEVAKYSGHGEKDAVDADGKPAYQSIQPSSSEVMANLVSFIQEQQAIIESLKARLDAANL